MSGSERDCREDQESRDRTASHRLAVTAADLAHQRRRRGQHAASVCSSSQRSGRRVLDAITRAGGIKDQGYATWLCSSATGRRATVPFENLVMDPGRIIFISSRRSDLRLSRTAEVHRIRRWRPAYPCRFARRVYFRRLAHQLAEGVAKAGGLNDAAADPGNIFLYRREPKEVAKLLGADVTRFSGDLVPVIFTVSFRDPGGYFLSHKNADAQTRRCHFRAKCGFRRRYEVLQLRDYRDDCGEWRDDWNCGCADCFGRGPWPCAGWCGGHRSISDLKGAPLTG